MADIDTQAPVSAADEISDISLTVNHHGKTYTMDFPPTATLADLNASITSNLSIPTSHQKFLISPKVGLLKPPYSDPDLPLSSLQNKKIQLLAPLPSDLTSLARPPPRPASALKPAKPSRTLDAARIRDGATYTFQQIAALPYLPDPGRSQQFLTRLAEDAGIRAAMRAHRFSVGLLTEMDPGAHTTRESRTLGLNRNRGQAIELRLRTDAYDGYRDYRTIRRTLCHELAHNVWGEHDRNFWDLTAEIEREVERADWTRGGRSVGEQEFYNPDDGGVPEGHFDGGGWTGGEFVLGGSGVAAGTGIGVSSRELMAQAAEKRIKEQKEERGREQDGDSR